MDFLDNKWIDLDSIQINDKTKSIIVDVRNFYAQTEQSTHPWLSLANEKFKDITEKNIISEIELISELHHIREKLSDRRREFIWPGRFKYMRFFRLDRDRFVICDRNGVISTLEDIRNTLKI